MAKDKKKLRKTTSCGAVVWRLREGQLELLLIKQFAHKDSWGIPKGHIDEGESLEECAVREVREETGVKVKLGSRLPDVMTHFKKEEKTVVSYLAQAVGDDEPCHDDPDSEVADARWVPASALPKIHIYQQPLIAEALARLNWRDPDRPTNDR